MEMENVKHETINKYYADDDCHRKNTATKGEALGIGRVKINQDDINKFLEMIK